MDNKDDPMLLALSLYNNQISSTEKLIRSLRIYPKVFDNDKDSDLHVFFDKALYSALNHLDLAIGLKHLDIYHSRGNIIEANYFSRTLILTCHEILNDNNKLIGKNVREKLIEKLGMIKIEKLDQSTKDINNLKKSHLKHLKDLRNSVIGHRQELAYEQSEIIGNIDLEEICKIGKKLFTTQTKLIGSLVDLLKLI